MAGDKIDKVMGEYKRGKLRSGSKSGPKVKNRKQAIAIGMNESGKSKPRKSRRRMPEPASDASFGVR